MSSLVPQLENTDKINLVFDKSLTKKRIVSFNEYLKNKISFLSLKENNDISINQFSYCHRSSTSEPCLQAADAIAGAYFQKYKKSNDVYVKIIEEKISSFRYLWK